MQRFSFSLINYLIPLISFILYTNMHRCMYTPEYNEMHLNLIQMSDSTAWYNVVSKSEDIWSIHNKYKLEKTEIGTVHVEMVLVS